MSVVEYFGYAH